MNHRIFFFISSLIIINHQSILPYPHKTLNHLTMHEAVSKALRFRPGLQALKYAVEAVRIDEKKAWTGYYPSVKFISDLSQARREGWPQATTQVTAKQLIYDFAGPQALYKQAKKSTAIERYREQTAKNDVQLAVEIAFLQCWKLQKQQKSIHALHQSSRAVFDKARHEKKVKLINKNDFLIQAENHSGTISTVMQYQNDVSIAQTNLEFLMGQRFNLEITAQRKMYPTTELSWSAKKDLNIQHKKFYIQKGLTHRPEIHEEQKRIEFQIEEMNIAANTRLPSLSVHAQAGYESRLVGKQKGFRCIGATFSWNLFDSLTSDYRFQQSHTRKLEAILNKQEIMNKVRSEVEVAYDAFEKEYAKLRAEKFKYARAKNEFRLRKQEFEIGLISDVQFETATSNWKTSRFSWLNQKAETATKKRELLHRTGYFGKNVV